MKKLSIVTINFNDKQGLRSTIASVATQSFTDYEYIVIDGASTDGSVEIIREYADAIASWVSEKDTGIYNAMNKGIAKATGEYILMMNSGDFFVNADTLQHFFEKVPANPPDILYGDILWNKKEGRELLSFPDRLTLQFFRHESLGHQATFIRKSLHEKIGMYNEKRRVVADWEFMVQAICKYNATYLHVPTVVAVCNRDGISCDPKNLQMVLAEKEDVLKTHFVPFLPDYEELDRALHKLYIVKINRIYKLATKLYSWTKKFKP